jgi:putative oxidoreductase
MKAIRAAFIVIARFLLSAVFLAAGINKIVHWQETEQTLMNVLSNWQSHMSGQEMIQTFFATAIAFTPTLLFLATLMELVGALLLLLGIKEKVGAALLLALLIPTTILFHQFWFVDGLEKELQQAMFLKNLAILGGLILVLLHGAGSPQKSSKTDY